MLKVSENARYLVHEDGTPFFYLVDTAWASFGNVPLALWEPYLCYRKMQGFNALQISILTIIHDRSIGPGLVEPFTEKENGVYNYLDCPLQEKKVLSMDCLLGLAACNQPKVAGG